MTAAEARAGSRAERALACRAALLALAMVASAAAAPAALPPTAVQRCDVAKLAAAATELRARLLCIRRDLAGDAPAGCADPAASKRDAAFARAERPGSVCRSVRDSAVAGRQVESLAGLLSLNALPGPEGTRCAERVLAAVSRAAWDLSRVWIADRRVPDPARLAVRHDAVRAKLVRALERVRGSCRGDALPIDAMWDQLRFQVDGLRRLLCPACGVSCPCWTVQQLDAQLSRAFLESRGGAVCDDPVFGLTTVRRCREGVGTFRRPRAGVTIEGGVCTAALDDQDRDRDGDCDGVPLVRALGASSDRACRDALRASRTRRESCDGAAPPPEIPAMELPGETRASSVNASEWITVAPARPPAPRNPAVGVVLPPDAGPRAAALPVPGCAHPPVSDCAPRAIVYAVGESDWMLGSRPGDDSTIAIGPAGEIVPLVAPPGEELPSAGLVGPGPTFVGIAYGDPTRVVVWRDPRAPYEALPIDGLRNGALARAIDADGRIVGYGLAPEVPVVWLRDGDVYRLERLPLPEGDTGGVALDVADGVIVGGSHAGGRERAVAWLIAGGGFAVSVLPLPAGATACHGASATSGGRVAGACMFLDALGNAFRSAVVWRTPDGGEPWSDAVRLLPLPGDDSANVYAMRGGLAVGESLGALGAAAFAQPAAWRLPSGIQRAAP